MDFFCIYHSGPIKNNKSVECCRCFSYLKPAITLFSPKALFYILYVSTLIP